MIADNINTSVASCYDDCFTCERSFWLFVGIADPANHELKSGVVVWGEGYGCHFSWKRMRIQDLVLNARS